MLKLNSSPSLPAPGGKGKRGRAEDAGEPDAPTEEATEPASAKRVRIKEPEPGAAAAAPAAGEAAADAGGDADAEMADGDEAGAGGSQEGQHGEGAAAGARGGAASSRPHYSDQQTVFIKGLRYGVKDSDLEAFLKQHVPEGIKAVRIPRDALTGQGRVSWGWNLQV